MYVGALRQGPCHAFQGFLRARVRSSMFWKTNTSICILVPVDFVPRCDRIMLGDHVAGRRGRTRKTHAALARQVVELTLSKGLRPGDHLPEQAFATFFAVSHTPMRATFRILAENGFLTARPDAGHALAVDPEAGGPAIERQLDAADGSLGDRILADRAARRLDDVLAVGVLIRRHRATRSAVLNALAVLQQDGIVEHAPGQSRAFRPILDTPGSDADSLQFRVLLEPAVIITPGFDLDQTRARHLRLQMQHALAENGVWIGAQAFHRQDTEFHGIIA